MIALDDRREVEVQKKYCIGGNKTVTVVVLEAKSLAAKKTPVGDRSFFI